MKKVAVVMILSILIPVASSAQTGVKKRRPLPYEYGRVLIGAPHGSPSLPEVRFDHWLHRAKFTCRLCHVDIGFAMKRNATGIKAEDNIKGYYCGTCHNGKMAHAGRLVFGACEMKPAAGESRSRCGRCHSAGEAVTPEYDFASLTAAFPKERFGNGIDWEKAEEAGLIKPADFIEGVSFQRRKLEIPKDFGLSPTVETMPEIVFSHRKHSKWSGCEGCHPEIFAGVKKGLSKYSMVEIFEGKYCGQCHLTVAFPTTDCQRCHAKPVR